ncbi:FecR family protein [Butyricimonas synergistica]|uniref:FecR family protein n=1 Tax=Butyricimonas synergistica TaxID=544644 RepID=UPI00037E9669|nr:FecR domain-containing protein [Butyricimonas synergistica]
MDDRKFKIVRLMYLYLSGMITEEERLELREWIDVSSRHKALFDRVNERQNLGNKYKACKSVNSDVAFKRFGKRVGIRSRGRYVWLKYVAMFVLPLGIALAIFMNKQYEKEIVSVEANVVPGKTKATLILSDGKSVFLQKDSVLDIVVDQGMNVKTTPKGIDYSKIDDGRETMRYNTLKTPRGGEFNVTLSDGSVVHLNSATTLKYPVRFDKEKREVYVSGEAYFEVKKEIARPFYVIVDDVRIRVYGTSFNVNTQHVGEVQAVLVEGSVGITINDGGKEYKMSPSQIAIYNKESAKVELKNVDTTPYVAWKDGYFVFEEQSLEEIMNTLSLWYDVEVFYVNAELKKLHFTGHMRRYEQVDNILKAIGGAVGVTFSIKERSIWISK